MLTLPFSGRGSPAAQGGVGQKGGSMKNSLNTGFYCASITSVLFALLLAAAAYGAFGYPAPRENYVNDFAGVIQPVDAQMLREKLQTLEKQTGIEGTVVTINSIAEYETGASSIEAFATGLFNKWGVGNKPANNGFMVLIAIQDRKCRIELGDGYGSQYNSRMKEIIDQTMVPRFKAGDYSRGTYEGTIAVIDSVTKKVSWLKYHQWHLLGFGAILLCVFAGISCIRNGRKGWAYVFFAAAGAILFWLIRSHQSKGDTSNSSGGFGGGSSSGEGGASGSW
jgi:uncharacterized protein